MEGGVSPGGRGQCRTQPMALAGSAALDVQAGGSQCCFSHVCLAANASLLPEDGEKVAQPEEWTDSARFLQGQEEKEQLRDAGQAGTASISQDIEIQVSWKGMEHITSQIFPGTCWAGLSRFWEKSGSKKG